LKETIQSGRITGFILLAQVKVEAMGPRKSLGKETE
jgi:hypothetical protein